MSQKINGNYICSCLDESLRVMGLTLDEFVPMCLIFTASLLTNNMIFGFIGMGLFYSAVKSLKKGQGAAIIFILFYRNTTHDISKILFSSFPESSKRIWW